MLWSVFSRFFPIHGISRRNLYVYLFTLGGSRFSFFFGGSTSGKPVNERTALQMTAVYSCVRILSEAVAGLPLHVYRYGENGSKVKALDHPLYRLLHDEPNPEMTSFNFRETLMGHLLLYGNAYAQIIRNGKGEVIGLYPLMPTKMTVDRDSKGQIYYLYTRGSDDSPVDDENGQVYLPPEQVLHIPGLGYDGIVGYSPIAMAKNAVGMAIACEEYGAKFFANDAAPGGVLEHPGVLKNPDKVRESWNKRFRGSANSHQIAVLEEGLKYQPIGISPEQAQFLETRKFQINEIARIFRVPPHMVGDLEKSSFFQHRAAELGICEIYPRTVAYALGTEHGPPPVFRQREAGVFYPLQCGGTAAGRLRQPYERLRGGPPEWLDERQRHKRAGKPRPYPRRGRRRPVSGKRLHDEAP